MRTRGSLFEFNPIRFGYERDETTNLVLSKSVKEPGPILVVYFLAAPITATAQRANVLFPIWVMCLVTASSLGILGEIENEVLLLSCLILPFSLFGAWLGSNIFKKAPVSWFKTLANWLLIVIGASLLLNQIFLT